MDPTDRIDVAQAYHYRLDWIASFVAVAEHGGFSAAATALYRSQPRISIQIAELERSLGVKLFDRSTHPAGLTPEGRTLLPHARTVLLDLETLCSSAASVEGSAHGDVRLGIYPSAAAFLLPQILATLRASYPGVRLVLREGPTESLDVALCGGEIDLAIRPMLPPARADRLGCNVLWREPLVVVVPVDHACAGERSLQLRDLAGAELITIGETGDRGTPQFETTLAFEQAGLCPSITLQTNQPQTLVALVRQGLGIGLTNWLAMATSNLDGVRLVPVVGASCDREVAIWWRSDQPASPARTAVQEVISALPGPTGPTASTGPTPTRRDHAQSLDDAPSGVCVCA